MVRNTEQNRQYMSEYRAKKKAEASKLQKVLQVTPAVTYIDVDEQLIKENILLIVNDPNCTIGDRLRACMLAKDLLKEKDSIERKPRPLLPPEAGDVNGFT